MRLGFSVRVLGKPGLRAFDGRRAANSPHLSASLVHLHDIFLYLAATGISMYRMSPDLAPYATHPDWPALHHQLEECVSELAMIGEEARHYGLRLSFHAPSHVALGSLDAAVVRQSVAHLSLLAGILDAMHQPLEAVIVVHSGGFSGGLQAVTERWIAVWDMLPAPIQRRLVLEHETDGLSLPGALHISTVTGIPVVFDYLHFQIHNPERWSLAEALAMALNTWPEHIRPKIHYATQRTEMRATQKHDIVRGRPRWILSPPIVGHHADFLNPWEFAGLVEASTTLRDFDIMLEAKAGDLALLRLTADLERYVPQIVQLLDPIKGAP